MPRISEVAGQTGLLIQIQGRGITQSPGEGGICHQTPSDSVADVLATVMGGEL